MPDPKEIQNPVAIIWNKVTLNNALRTIRLATRLRITRDRTAGTVIVYRESDGYVYLRGVLSPNGWLVRYDGKLLRRKDIKSD